jgi:putative lipoic acid-binding regulatory protein
MVLSLNEECSRKIYNKSSVEFINLYTVTVLSNNRNDLQDEIIVLIQYEKRDNPVPSTSQKD